MNNDQPTSPASPSRDDTATIYCLVCEHPYTRSGRQRYCSETCRKTAWRRRHQAVVPTADVPAARSSKPGTVYECASCGTRQLGQQYCDQCRTFMHRIGRGGHCPTCDEPVAIVELTRFGS